MIKDLSNEILLKYHKNYITNEDYDILYTRYREQFIELRNKIKNWSEFNAEDFKITALGFANAWKSRTKNNLRLMSRYPLG
jgi:hypothetical protein